MTKKTARLLKAEQVWIDYNAIDENGVHSLARAEFAKAKITNGTAPLTPEAVDIMAEQVRKRVERREMIEADQRERDEHNRALDAKRREEAEERRHIERLMVPEIAASPLVRADFAKAEEAFLAGDKWTPEQAAKIKAQLRPDDRVTFTGSGNEVSAAEAFPNVFRQPSPADLMAESMDEHLAKYTRFVAMPSTPGDVLVNLETMFKIAELVRAFYAPFSVDKGPTLLRLVGDDIPAPSLVLDRINTYLTTGETDDQEQEYSRQSV
jgi:hypothetical protein